MAAGCGPVEPVSIAWNAAFIAASPVGTALFDECDEFAPTRTAQRWCQMRQRLFGSDEQRLLEARLRQSQRHVCRRSLADVECTAIVTPGP
jgi:hypothetical protein